MKDREFINPFTDFGFKRIFGQEISKDILIDFLNLLLNGEQRIVSLSFKNTELQPDIKDKRRVVFDVYCESDNGTEFIVEMQAARQEFFYDRGLYYQSRALAEQGNKGKDWQYDLKPVYGIFFMDFIMHENSKFRTDVALMDMETGKVFNNRLRQIFLEMPRFTKEANECDNDYERWLYLIKNMHMLKRMPFNAQRAVWDKLLDIADVAALNETEYKEYQEALKNYRDYHAGINFAKKEGMLEGEQKGLIKGEKRGAQKKQLEIARNLKKDSMPIELIHKYTGLSAEEIQKL